MSEQMLAWHKRNSGIDLLRIISMLMIVVLHILAHGGLLGTKTELPGGRYEIVWFLETAAYCGVNCYALISGYVGVDREYRFTKIVPLHFQVLFYTIGIAALGGDC